ncbi:acyltransferase domain-containing protein [Rubrobacter tropicus]|uniref:[acyl-carrier-protein] S-malonyltransferase n=1 Tax=Rubrobacter tropicus TaxID=2653851 RepID=A0A6G8Q8Y7_9ACTN|nr:ACP S-malonyltransferase [Rubrobacter tropicus]QIN82940.1 acyltransferase domain-containing protein [Rubrobacter tropicus]
MARMRAVVFPGQGTAGGEVTGKVEEALRNRVGDGEPPYQLAVFASSVSLFHRLRGAGVEPDVVAGHSLGEYAAAHAAGSLGLEDGVRLVAERDRLMTEASEKTPGGMVAVIGADVEEVERAVDASEGVVVAANYNTPRQTVISGEKGALEGVAGEIKGRKVPLRVVGAFHSPLMEGAAARMEKLLNEVEFAEPAVPMVGAASGEVLRTAREVREALREQMLSPVRWAAVMGRFFEMGVEEIVEAGEDGTLTRMLRDFKREDVTGVTAKEALS